MRYLIVCLRGGLGNQMFQYGAGRQYALEDQLRLYLDTSYYTQQHLHAPNDTPRTFRLDQLMIDATVIWKFAAQTAFKLSKHSRLKRHIRKIPIFT